MGKSKNTNPNIYRSKWDMEEGLDTDYRRGKNKRIIEEQLRELEEEKLAEEKRKREEELDEFSKEVVKKVDSDNNMENT